VAGPLFARERWPKRLVLESNGSVVRSDYVSAAVPGCDRALTAPTFKGEVEFLRPHTRGELGDDQHLLHDKQLVSSQRPRLLGGCLEERDPSALIVDEQRTAVNHDV
jgi:hypothetical protein